MDRAIGASSESPFVLCYHSVSLSGWRFAVRPSDFQQQISYLADHHPALRPDQLEAFLTTGQPMARSSFLVTFDDGYRDIMDTNHLFERLGIRPMLFMISHAGAACQHVAPEGEFLRDDELRALSRAGWHIASHSQTHADLPPLLDASLREEVHGSKQRLETVVGKEVRYFAFPRGRYTARVIRSCQSAGYAAAFSMDDGFLTGQTDRFRLPRVGVDGTHTFQEFRSLVSPSAVRLRRLVKRSPLANLL